MTSVAIIDYGVCNLDSVARAVQKCGGRPIFTDRADEIAAADRIVLPGVGAFATAMGALSERGCDQALRREVARRPVPFLGICLGMQLLASRSLEGGETEGLGLIEGDVVRLQPGSDGERVPHMGWNELHPLKSSPLLDGIADGTDFYFVHSFHFRCRDRADVLAATPYCGGFTSVVNHGSIFGTQFHPEKSMGPGFAVLKNFLSEKILARC